MCEFAKNTTLKNNSLKNTLSCSYIIDINSTCNIVIATQKITAEPEVAVTSPKRRKY